MENNTQKICKLSISSSSPSEFHSEDSIDYERTPSCSLNPTQESISELMSIIRLTLSQRGISQEPKEENFEGLKSLLTALCTEFLKSTKSDIPKVPCYSIDAGFEMAFIPDPKAKVIDKLFYSNEPENSFSTSECKMLSSLIVELLRGSTESKINSKIQELQLTIVNSAKVINNLRQELKEKDELLTSLQKNLEPQMLPQIFKPIKKSKYNESQSTLNESEDIFL